ncbi:astacin [Teladorsagia circumcincta]|uniref:Metalloendopeptidase n=1 Tax=Teladorsagia circumcincta TaxID=45464 RepID=A0A2G9UFM4_TELCI|nr:astacin [Teladorsagia circumcincta]
MSCPNGAQLRAKYSSDTLVIDKRTAKTDLKWKANVPILSGIDRRRANSTFYPSYRTQPARHVQENKDMQRDDTDTFPARWQPAVRADARSGGKTKSKLLHKVPLMDYGRRPRRAANSATVWNNLTDLLQPNANRRIFDTLSAIVANEYETGRARENVIRAINFWQSETCINFRPRTNERHFVEFIGNDDGCWSTVGKDEAIGRQFGVTSHELAHSLGVFHEQSRYDRDATVQLNRNVVDPTLLFNFAKIGPKELNTYRLPYDVGSVMHYTPTECPTGFGGQLCNQIPPSFSSGCGGELIAYEAVRRFDITIKQIGQRRTKQCIYHLKILLSASLPETDSIQD